MGTSMRDFWDARAAEDAFHFVDSREPYRTPDRERFWRGGERALTVLREQLGVEPGPAETVVEIGCGVGRLTRVLAGRSGRVLAFDVSPRMLAIAAREHPGLDNVEWLLGDGRSLRPLPDGCADGVLSLLVLQHLPEPELALGYVREAGRVLRPGGWAALGVSNDPRVHRRPGALGRLARLLRARLPWRPAGHTEPAWLGSAVELDAVRDAAAGAGLKLERVAGEGTQYCHLLLRRA